MLRIKPLMYGPGDSNRYPPNQGPIARPAPIRVSKRPTTAPKCLPWKMSAARRTWLALKAASESKQMEKVYKSQGLGSIADGKQCQQGDNGQDRCQCSRFLPTSQSERNPESWPINKVMPKRAKMETLNMMLYPTSSANFTLVGQYQIAFPFPNKEHRRQPKTTGR